VRVLIGELIFLASMVVCFAPFYDRLFEYRLQRIPGEIERKANTQISGGGFT
jgi:hypothetical protein